MGLTLLVVVLPLLLAACGGGGGSPEATASATASASGTPQASPQGTATPQLPEGFPSDFPLYVGGTITAAGRVHIEQGDIYDVGMETADTQEEVRSFYEDALNTDSWEVTSVVEIAEEGTVVIRFARRDGGGLAGTVAVSQEQTDGEKTIIAIQLPAGNATATATPTASLGP